MAATSTSRTARTARNTATDAQPTTTRTTTAADSRSSARSRIHDRQDAEGGNNRETEFDMESLHPAGVHTASAIYTPQIKGTERPQRQSLHRTPAPPRRRDIDSQNSENREAHPQVSTPIPAKRHSLNNL